MLRTARTASATWRSTPVPTAATIAMAPRLTTLPSPTSLRASARGLARVATGPRIPALSRPASTKVFANQAASEANEIEHAVISTFDLFSVGIGPSSSHTVGPMRAGVIFVSDLYDLGLLSKVNTIKIAVYGSLALTGAGHATPEALLSGLEGDDCETVDPPSVPARFAEIKSTKKLFLGKHLARTLKRSAEATSIDGKEIAFDYQRDFKWNFGQVLPHHPNGLRLSVFDEAGEMLATNDYYSVGGGFVVNGALATPPAKSSSDDAPSTAESFASLEAMKTDTEEVSARPIDFGENVFYKQLRRQDAEDVRRSGSSTHDGLLPQVEAPSASLPGAAGGSEVAVRASEQPAEVNRTASKPANGPLFPFHNAASLLRQCKTRNLTIAQIVYENELTWNPPEVVTEKLFRIWSVMDACIRAGVESTEKVLPGPLAVRRRAPALYSRLMRGVYRGSALPAGGGDATNSGALGSGGAGATGGPGSSSSDLVDLTQSLQLSSQGPKRIIGSMNHPVMPCPPKRANFAAIDYLSCYAIATNEQNAAGGRIVTAPTNGAAGVLPAVLKYCFEFIFDDDPGRDVQNFLLTAAAIGMLFKRGATLSAAEGGCMAEVGVATAMAAAGFVAVLGGSPEKILQASGISCEHHLGLTCDPFGGQVQVPCIERNALGAVKAVTAAQLALAGDGQHSVSLDDAITAMRETAKDMHTNYKETSLGGLAVAVRIPVTVPDC
ncbi:uncharacterized protein PFL1_00068 [Pseudozyma flocculosa PF-1]|uniref:uncharacterized protein n=1 Tax=Pseudozyma flocculosa PF-1 TaxID=1277687 RepID=UPI00045601A9|nr:uncharacterized protein PFL1_00068 [Pseudozyma flocculosa PF-1]EPQ31869.1 hypothetical protein PFL1_00068 [Pseudozyma flocculosa PF-1]